MNWAIQAGICGLAVAGAVLPARGQVELTARVENDQVLLYERLPIEVKVTNRAGTPLMVGEGGDAVLDIRVERRPGQEAPRQAGRGRMAPVLVKAGATQTIRLDLNDLFDLRRTGAITILPRLRYEGQTYSARRLLVEIVPGLEVARFRYMVPGAEGGVRLCSLRTLHRDRAQRIFFRLENETDKLCYGVFDLGRLVSHAQPTLESDTVGQVHVLHQSGPLRFTHSVFKPNGEMVKQEFLSKGNGPTRLVRGEDGTVKVSGVQTYEGDPYLDRPVIKPFDPFATAPAPR